MNCPSHPRIQFHCVHASGVPRKHTSLNGAKACSSPLKASHVRGTRMRRWSTFTAPGHVATAARCGLFLLRRSYLRIRVTSTIESDGLRSGRNRGTATIRDRLATYSQLKRLGSIEYLLIMVSLALFAGRGGRGARCRAKERRQQPGVQIELTYAPFPRYFRQAADPV
jgi:hypothetical protein